MAVGSRIVVLVFALLAALPLAGCEGQKQLFANLSERDANEVLSALADVGIDAEKVPAKDGINVEVAKSTFSRANAHLNLEGLPRKTRPSMCELFKREGLISSPLEERIRYICALQQELERTLSMMDGVTYAGVHVVLPERSSGTDPAMPSSAGVLVKYRRGANMDEGLPNIRRLVASSIPGLQPEKVSVVLLPSGLRPAAEPRPASSAPRNGNGKANVNGNGNAYPPSIAAWMPWLPAIGGVLFTALVAGGVVFTLRRRARAATGAQEAAVVPVKP